MLNNRLAVGTAAVCLAIGGLAGCSSNSGDATTSPSADASTSPSASASGGESLVALDKKIQEELNAVGCNAGPVDGILGPQTDAAVVRFQEAQGIPADGELGPATDLALKKAVADGTQACTTTTASPTSSPSPSSSSDSAKCTAVAISGALPAGDQLQSFVCVNVSAERWAAGQAMSGPAVTNFFLKAEGSTWTTVSNDDVCGAASAGLPQKILDYCGLT